jgi:hypothetical protein
MVIYGYITISLDFDAPTIDTSYPAAEIEDTLYGADVLHVDNLFHAFYIDDNSNFNLFPCFNKI